MIKKPRYTFGREISKSDLRNLRDHLKGRNSVSKTVKSTLYPAKRVTRECVSWELVGWRHRRLIEARASGMFRHF